MSRLLDFFGKGNEYKFYMRDYKNAYHLRPDVNPPRQRFQGYVNFIFNRSLLNSLYDTKDNDSFRTTISSLVRVAELPGVNFKTETINSYNRKRIVQTGVEYTPVNMTVLDTVGNEWLSTIMKYFSYYYMNPRNHTTLNDSTDIVKRDLTGATVSSSFYDLYDSGFGNTGRSRFDSNEAGLNIGEIRNFFERIDYILYHKNKGVQYSLINPYITSIKFDSINYADSNPIDINLTLEYESFTTASYANFNLSQEDLKRFEDASELTGPPFIGDNAAAAATKQQEFKTLGTDPNSPVRRTKQVIPDPIIGADDSSASISPVYGPGVEAKKPTKRSSRDNILDVVLDTIDNGVTAAINGQDVGDAVLGTALGGITNIIAGTAGNPDSGGPAGITLPNIFEAYRNSRPAASQNLTIPSPNQTLENTINQNIDDEINNF